MTKFTKADYTRAKAEADAAYAAMNATPDAQAFRDAQDRLEAVQKNLGLHDDICEGCGCPIFDGDPKCYSPEDGITTCKECSPTWQEFQGNPEDFCRLGACDVQYHTAETAAPYIAAHLASGGALTDSMAR